MRSWRSTRAVTKPDLAHARRQPPVRVRRRHDCDLLNEWSGDERTRQRILVANPAELYGF